MLEADKTHHIQNEVNRMIKNQMFKIWNYAVKI